MALSDGKYILLTTFRRDGTGVATPVWVVPLDGGTFGMWTSSGSGKAKRLAHTDRVLVRPSDARGRVKDGTAPLEGTARLVTGAEHEAIVGKIKAKYGFVTNVTHLLNTVGGIVKGKRIPYGDRGVVITLANSA
jgi:PPOX class probable F420-dependent enzyme